MSTCAAMAASLPSPALSLRRSTIFDSPRLRRLSTSAGRASPLRSSKQPTSFVLGGAGAEAGAETEAEVEAEAARLPPSAALAPAAPAAAAPHESPSSSPGRRSLASATGRNSASSTRLHARLQEQHALLLHAQEQAREAYAAGELAHAERTRSQLWRAVQLAAPVLCALFAGFALGETIGRPTTARGR